MNKIRISKLNSKWFVQFFFLKAVILKYFISNLYYQIVVNQIKIWVGF